MAGSPRSKASNTRLLLALLAVLSLVAAACGGSDATQTASDQLDSLQQDSAQEEIADAETESAEPKAVEADAQVEDEDEAMAESDVVEEAAEEDIEEAAADAPDAEVDENSGEAEAVTAGSGDPALAQVLAFALENSDSQSYSFTQGMAMRMNIAGQRLDIAPEDAYVFGEVDGNNVHMEMDMGVFMGAMFGSLGIDVTEAPFDEIFGALGEARIESWTDETTVVMDMSGFASAMSGIDPGSAGELSAFADGPVKIDLTQVDGIDATSLANQFGQGAQVTNPSDLLQALRVVDAATETGTDSVNGVDVRVFTADLSLPTYYDALGLDLNAQLDAANLGDLAPGDADALNAILPALEQVRMSLIVMIDGDDLVRRMDTSIDMGAMMTAMFSDLDLLALLAAEEGQSVESLQAEMASVFGDGLELTIDTWQEFDNYGEAFVIEPPDAVDITAELDLAS